MGGESEYMFPSQGEEAGGGDAGGFELFLASDKQQGDSEERETALATRHAEAIRAASRVSVERNLNKAQLERADAEASLKEWLGLMAQTMDPNVAEQEIEKITSDPGSYVEHPIRAYKEIAKATLLAKSSAHIEENAVKALDERYLSSTAAEVKVLAEGMATDLSELGQRFDKQVGVADETRKTLLEEQQGFKTETRASVQELRASLEELGKRVHALEALAPTG